MNGLPDELERQMAAHETARDDAAGARDVLEAALLTQVRAVADGLLADTLLRGRPFDAHAWWHQFLSRRESPSSYFPDLTDAEFISYRKEFAQKVAAGRVKRVGLAALPDLQVRILGGLCRFSEEGRINRQLARLGSSLRLITVGASNYRAARMRSLLGGRGGGDGATLDGRFILGRIGPASAFGVAVLYLFERELALSPYMEAMATGFTDGARIVVRKDVLRGEVEEMTRRFEAERSRPPDAGSEGEGYAPYTVAHGEIWGALHSEEESHDPEALLRRMTESVLIHEAAHVLYNGSRISEGTPSATAWRQAAREDLLRFAQEPRTFEAFRESFGNYFPGGGLMTKMFPAFELPTPEHGYTLEGEIEALRDDGLLFIDRENRYYSKLYGRGERWTL